MFDEQYVAMLTCLNPQQRKLLIDYYAGLDEQRRVEAHRRQREFFKDWLAQGKTATNRNGETNYAALLMSLRSILVDEQREMPASATLAKQTVVAKVRKPRKQRLRSNLEKRYLNELIRLREEEGLSWRQLSEHFRKQFRKTVSHTYLKLIYEEHCADGQQ